MDKMPKCSSITKKRYNLIKLFLEEKYDKTLSEDVCNKICEVFKFDPNYVDESKTASKKTMEWRQRKAKELGVSQHQIMKGLKNITLDKGEKST